MTITGIVYKKSNGQVDSMKFKMYKNPEWNDIWNDN